MVGIDIVFLDEFKKQADLGGSIFLERLFSVGELQNERLEHRAGLFAAKEAVMKALSLAPGAWQEICIAYRDNGQPYALVAGEEVSLSIAHHGDYAVAVAVNPSGMKQA